ncbi:MAG: amidohydrolase [Hyphomicrobiales bacterium]
MSHIKVFSARKIITMDPNRPEATHVAVRDGRILAVESEEEVAKWGNYDLDDRYGEKVIMPGFVEGHAHVMAGAVWKYAYAGFHDRMRPDGSIAKAMTTIDTVLDRLKEAESKLAKDEPLVGWGFDPIFLEGRRLDRHHLDEVSSTRPIVVMHSNFHLLTANTPALQIAGYEKGANVEGVVLEEDGTPAGELQEMAAMFPVLRRLKINFDELSSDPDGVRAYGDVARLCGVTTVTDLYADLTLESVNSYLDITSEKNFPARLVPALNALGGPAEDIAHLALNLREKSTDKLRLGIVKLMTDGSIQGFTAQVKEPYYFKGPNNGIWNIAPEQMYKTVALMHKHGLHMHIHVNGDLASEVSLDALDEALSRHPRGDHRHTLQHGQMMTKAQFKRAKALGCCVNLFANHIYYFGDKHRDLTLGLDRARRMNACADALDVGVPLAIHSDAPVTPMAPLFTAWAAVNRRTADDDVLGEHQCISVADAMHAITLGAAYTLKMDEEIGSIECGKRADFAVLSEDPFEVDPLALKDIPVVATVLDGDPTL